VNAATVPVEPAEISPAGLASANENWPIVELVPSGDDAILARTLMRVLARRALISEGVFSVGLGPGDQIEQGRHALPPSSPTAHPLRVLP